MFVDASVHRLRPGGEPLMFAAPGGARAMCRRMAVSVAAAAMLLAAGCGSAAAPSTQPPPVAPSTQPPPAAPSTQPSPSTQPAGSSAASSGTHVIQLGAAVAETGSLAAEGKEMVAGYDFGVKWIDRHGGVKVNGTKYTFAPVKYYDDASRPALDAKLIDRLVTRDHIRLLLGPYSSNNTLAAAAASSRDGAVMVADGGVAKQIWTSGYKGVVGPLMYGSQYMNPVVDALLARHAGVKTAVVLHAGDAFSVGAAKGAEAYMRRKGIKVLGDFQYRAGATDASSILARVKALHADILLGSGHLQGAIVITRQIAQDRLDFKAVAFTVAPPTAAYRQALGKASEDVIGPAPWLPQEDFKDPYWGSTQAFDRAATAAGFGRYLDYHFESSAVSVELFAEAIARVGSLSASKVSQGFRNTTYQTLSGPIHFGSDWHETNQTGAAMQIQNGRAVPIWPERYAHNLVYPMPPWSQR